MSSNLTDYRQRVSAKSDTFYKTTLFRGDFLMLGLNCLEPGQMQSVHDHADQDKFYAVLEGVGVFTVGDDIQAAGPGNVVWAPAGRPHGVRNEGAERLVLLMGIAPPPSP